jgi:hypothetical protein
MLSGNIRFDTEPYFARYVLQFDGFDSIFDGPDALDCD